MAILLQTVFETLCTIWYRFYNLKKCVKYQRRRDTFTFIIMCYMQRPIWKLCRVKTGDGRYNKFQKIDNLLESYPKPQNKAKPPGRCMFMQNVAPNILNLNLLWLLQLLHSTSKKFRLQFTQPVFQWKNNFCNKEVKFDEKHSERCLSWLRSGEWERRIHVDKKVGSTEMCCEKGCLVSYVGDLVAE